MTISTIKTQKYILTTSLSHTQILLVDTVVPFLSLFIYFKSYRLLRVGYYKSLTTVVDLLLVSALSNFAACTLKRLFGSYAFVT